MTPAADQEIGPGYFAAILGALTPGVITVDEGFTIRWRNRSAELMVPEARPGLGVYEALAPFAHEQKIDRLMLRRELVTISPGPDRPNLEWLNCRERLPGGEFVLLTWRSGWTDQLNDRRVAFTMAASHELRTPLTVLLGFIELLAMDTDGLTPGQLEAIEMIDQTGRHLRSLVDDIFDLTKNSFGELRLALEPTGLDGIVESVAGALRPQTVERGQTLATDCEPGLPAIEVDPARIRQVASNLIGNASVHNPEGTAIEVTLRREGDGIELAVADDGVGIGFEHPEDAFHSFARGAAAIEGDLAGSGIGLAVAKRLVELHRGRMRVDTAPGEGTRISIWLPADRSSALTPGEPGPA